MVRITREEAIGWGKVLAAVLTAVKEASNPLDWRSVVGFVIIGIMAATSLYQADPSQVRRGQSGV